MKICVVGLGKVGRPLYDVLQKWHQVVGYDIDPAKGRYSISQCVAMSDVAIFVVGTPSLPDGSFSNEYLVQALTGFRDEVKRQNKEDYLYVVTSTTVPGSCEQFREIVGENIVYNPLFIRLEHIYDDLLNPSFLLVGSPTVNSIDQWLGIWGEVRRTSECKTCSMSLTEAELCKITLNCALTMKISLANQLHLVATKMNCDPKKIMNAVGTDPRIGNAYLEPGWPYLGPCLPRDNKMFQYVADRVGVHAVLSRAADAINDQMVREMVERNG